MTFDFIVMLLIVRFLNFSSTDYNDFSSIRQLEYVLIYVYPKFRKDPSLHLGLALAVALSVNT